MNWNSPVADELLACAHGLSPLSSLAEASIISKFMPLRTLASRIADTTPGVAPAMLSEGAGSASEH